MQTTLTFFEYVRSIITMFVFMLILLLVSVLVTIIVLLTFGKATNWIVKTFPRYMGKPIFFLLGIDYQLNDLRKDTSKPVIFIFNHCSTLDIPAVLMLALERFRIVIKWELQYIPFFFIIGRLTGQVFIKRSDKEHAIATLQKTYDRLRENNLNLILAPEGSRKHEGKIGPFKKGAFRMAIDLGYPIVPIYFDGNDRLSMGGSLMAKQGKITATIHPQIDTSSWNIDTIDDHIEEVRSMYLDWAGV
ncbi:MAG: 1-acyl-sn-glycerol-3-phosphate acyltransferase [Balneola sp.]|nr:1-acyl-sn-glycerol-3-phosphate acyltransferase [Balneola sp.]MBO6650487.1 1-acyl-sn-glycerol-3-phosphate acyltransferase [Balneola sp.]MBO6711484.1 1-acyl-sn-glycerol-3-phosphate acyltransferase [Balneola sp.]MBO6799680.1 1-acyl-sn-glycerol-3-phosphate acyltransferase [Balneola sp.]MBO6870879.1 1-acyl-sn-glycerol-3-phosphate acyltransferase [Balneola sp.]